MEKTRRLGGYYYADETPATTTTRRSTDPETVEAESSSVWIAAFFGSLAGCMVGSLLVLIVLVGWLR